MVVYYIGKLDKEVFTMLSKNKKKNMYNLFGISTLTQRKQSSGKNWIKNKEERYSRVPRLSDTRYSKGNGDMQAAKRN